MRPSREGRWRDTGVPVPRTEGACFGPLGRWEPARLNLSRRRAIDPAKVKAIRAARRAGKSVRAVAAQFGVGGSVRSGGWEAEPWTASRRPRRSCQS